MATITNTYVSTPTVAEHAKSVESLLSRPEKERGFFVNDLTITSEREHAKKGTRIVGAAAPSCSVVRRISALEDPRPDEE